MTTVLEDLEPEVDQSWRIPSPEGTGWLHLLFTNPVSTGQRQITLYDLNTLPDLDTH